METGVEFWGVGKRDCFAGIGLGMSDSETLNSISDRLCSSDEADGWGR